MESERVYIVTGAAGHLGSTIIRQLAKKHCNIIGLLYYGQKEAVSAPGIAYVHGDVTDTASLCLKQTAFHCLLALYLKKQRSFFPPGRRHRSELFHTSFTGNDPRYGRLASG